MGSNAGAWDCRHDTIVIKEAEKLLRETKKLEEEYEMILLEKQQLDNQNRMLMLKKQELEAQVSSASQKTTLNT